MTSTFHSIETAKRSLFTQTAALNTTGHNVANANTEGYSRQVVKMEATRPLEAFGMTHSTFPGQLGTGVEVTSIERVREKYLDTQYRNENADLGNYTIQKDSLDKLQAIFNEPSDTGIRTVVDNFYKAWSDLSKDPESVTARTIVKESALALTDAMNHMSKQLSDLSTDLTTNIATKGTEIQTYLTAISNLNQSITKIESSGDKANDLRDQRDLLTDKLSKIVNINVTDSDQGYNISIGGQALVTGFTVAAAQVDGAFLTGAFASGDLKGGEVYGMIVSRDNYVADYTNQLNSMANTLANGDINIKLPKGSVIPDGTTVRLPDGTTKQFTGSVAARTLGSDLNVVVAGLNGLHQLGYTKEGQGANGKPITGLPFFTASDNGTITASNITLNAAIADDPTKIATSLRVSDTENLVQGNNTIASLISNLKTTAFTTPGTTKSATIDSYFSSMVGQLGIQAQEADRLTDNSTSLVSQVETMRQSVSGVSLDEEMSNMIKFQHAYSAASRFMTTFDQLLDKLINSTGTVGR
ncbi:flagellar hook-associated protein FlgK [Paenibacillus sp. JX-17]|uniref:Flagellar hook-associated protein 1 n=1 Tax=Paenibacillus lacisoli TaxID=3064525 RepID=A0ABT9CBF2_9BACL|nr:flagellar hook-associated protein FlgK [Paenibacillus sp. JX-17]MDO7906562.1 flagellar hook-associated protein FlgK [Paenibacillus sp. JX-17]